MDVRPATIETDGGPWALHDQGCAVCHVNHAVLDLNSGRFLPCGTCQADGWELRRRPRWLRALGRQR